MGGHVRVTAEYEGKEYLFADVNLMPGTYELPVTVPVSVTTLKITTPSGVLLAGVNDVVDIDNPQSGASRVGDWTVSSSSSDLKFVSKGPNIGPYLIFKPSELLADYFQNNPIGQDNTDYWYQKKADGSILYEEGIGKQVFWGETAIGDGDTRNGNNHNLQYYIFPIWWRSGKNGIKDYEFYLFQSKNDPEKMQGAYHLNKTRMYFERFYDQEQVVTDPVTSSVRPFPELGYSDNMTDIADVDINNVAKGFTFDDDSFDRAFPLDGQGMVLSRGVKISYTEQGIQGNALGKNYAGFYLSSEGGNNKSLSVPKWNGQVWKDGDNCKYFDEQIKNLFFATVSTKRTMVPDKKYFIRENTIDPDGNYIGNLEFVETQREHAFIIGFNSAPAKAADTAPRDYADVLFLVVPVTETDFGYIYDVNPEPMIWTVAAEDLGSTEDWDFNDAVIQFTDVIVNLNSVNKNCVAANVDGPLDAVTVREVTVKPMAAGGTMPIYITFDRAVYEGMPDMARDGDEWYSTINSAASDVLKSQTAEKKTRIVGKELHKWLGGASHTTPLNVGAKRIAFNGQEVRFCIPSDKALITGKKNMMSKNGFSVCGFAVLVDKNNVVGVDALNDINRGLCPVDYTMGQGIYTVGAVSETGGAAPQLIVVNGNWEWPSECKKISNAYPKFSEWVMFGGGMYPTWHTLERNDSHITVK